MVVASPRHCSGEGWTAPGHLGRAEPVAWAVAVLGWTQRVTVVAGLGMGRP